MIENPQPVHGGDRWSACAGRPFSSAEVIDFSANIMPFGLRDAVRRAIMDGLDQCCHYPDPSQHNLRQALALWHQLSPEQVVCGNGAADVLYRSVHVLKPHRVFLPVPTFLEYEKACREQNAQVIHYYLPQDHDFTVTEDLIDWLNKQEQTQETSLLILCNPNNPTGLLIDPDLLERILACCQELGIHVLLDECFLDFVDQPAVYSKIEWLQASRQASLLILNSMTKFYAMPGLRLGYLCTDPVLAQAIQAAGQPWPVGTLAEIAGLAALAERQQEPAADVMNRQLWLKQEREGLTQALSKRGWQVWPGQANYLLFQAVGQKDLVERFLNHRILIRSCANYPGLGPEYYRIAVKTKQDNQILYEILANGNF